MILLDDVLNGLDTNTENKVFQGLFAEDGLLRTGDVTVVLAASDG